MQRLEKAMVFQPQHLAPPAGKFSQRLVLFFAFFVLFFKLPGFPLGFDNPSWKEQVLIFTV